MCKVELICKCGAVLVFRNGGLVCEKSGKPVDKCGTVDRPVKVLYKEAYLYARSQRSLS